MHEKLFVRRERLPAARKRAIGQSLGFPTGKRDAAIGIRPTHEARRLIARRKP